MAFSQKDYNALRSIEGLKSEPEEETKLFGLIPSGGYQSALTPEQSKVVQEEAKNLGIDPNLVIKDQLTPAEWKQITGQAKTDVSTHKAATAPGAQPKETLQQAEDSAINDMYQSVLGQFQTAANTVNPYISGAQMPAESQNAMSLATAMSGGGVQGPNASIQGVLNKDFQAEATANEAGQQGIANAIVGQDKASQQAAQVAPYTQLLNALASKAQYNITYQGAQPNVASSPSYVQEALANANTLQVGGAGSATTPAPAPPASSTTPVTTSGSGFQSTTG
jgi:hypothetical protein